jgi:pimeloyl-ACP methyl ester carboxylesterase
MSSSQRECPVEGENIMAEQQAAGMGLSDLREGYAEIGDVRLHYVEAGAGPLVVLLHGFPEFWYGWRLQIKPLAAAGFRVVAPDMRGYNLSSRPGDVAAYETDHLTADIRDLIRERGAQSALLAGHDWGGSVAWATAMKYPEVVDRLAILNAAHPRKLSGGKATATSAPNSPSPTTTMCPTWTASSACRTRRTGCTTTRPTASPNCSSTSSPPPGQPRTAERGRYRLCGMRQKLSSSAGVPLYRSPSMGRSVYCQNVHWFHGVGSGAALDRLGQAKPDLVLPGLPVEDALSV